MEKKTYLSAESETSYDEWRQIIRDMDDETFLRNMPENVTESPWNRAMWDEAEERGLKKP